MSSGARARNFILKTEEGHAVHRRFLNGVTALYAGDMATLSSNVLAEVADSNTVGAVGVCAEDIAASSYGNVYITGMFITTTTGTDFGLGDYVYNGSDTLLDAGSGSDVPVGKAVHEEPTAATTVYFELMSIILHQIDGQ